MLLRNGMTIALEPMVLMGSPATRVRSDQWTVAAANGKPTGHFEHTIAITESGPRILTLLADGTAPVGMLRDLKELPVA
jgi:methionyl aminopeptidase